MDIRNGDMVVVESRRGEVQLPAWINGRGRPPRGTIFVPFFDESKLINDVTLEAHRPVLQAAGLQEMRRASAKAQRLRTDHG